MTNYIWGVHSQKAVSEEFFACVIKHFGYPKFWGRYLKASANHAEGLSKTEIAWIRRRKIRLLPIHGVVRNANGYHEGRIAATNAIFQARQLEIPRGTLLFAGIDKTHPVDARWVEAWVETLYKSGYRSGIYSNPVYGSFSDAFCQAARENDRVEKHCILWGTEPAHGPTDSKTVPPFKASSPPHPCNMWVWRYGKDTERCSVNTCLANTKLLPFLW
ncbi:glycoside hydrolase domain-containing protein [Ectobacillus panaciterrae]|uniref:glycoside hydrolase domain-containing protein n=1 Tax=Ectobacillus panaciterrae TaxID=363872 RepID=UPI00040CB150|nr:glycoside hydrolase domain-containing protein [Ectobacillus panaciterrae]